MVRSFSVIRSRWSAVAPKSLVVYFHKVVGAENVAMKTSGERQITYWYRNVIKRAYLRTDQSQQPPSDLDLALPRHERGADQFIANCSQHGELQYLTSVNTSRTLTKMQSAVKIRKRQLTVML